MSENRSNEAAEAIGEDSAPDELGLDQETLERRREALARVRQFGDPSLKARALPITDYDERLRVEVEEMGAIMRDALGVGLAATQLGLMRRLLVFQPGPDAPLIALTNPETEWFSHDAEVAVEGCLSLPGVAVEVERSLHVRVRGRDERGAETLLEASGLEARVLQHEIDHLDGILILDRTTREQRREAIRELGERSGVAAPH